MTRTAASSRLTVVVAALLVAWGQTPRALADAAVYQKTVKATCWIVVLKGKELGYGTGWVIDKDKRYVITNDHVVGDKKEAMVYFPIVQGSTVLTPSKHYEGTGISAKIIRVDGKRDLALLQLSRLPANVGVLPLADKSPGVGTTVHSVGNSPMAGKAPQDGSLWLYRGGKITDVGFMVYNLKKGGKVEARTIETDSGIRPGDSGGPLVDSQGKLVGVISSHFPGTKLSRAIDLRELRAFLLEAKKASRGSPLEGFWTMRFPMQNVKDNEAFLGIAFLNTGKVIVDGAKKSWVGTYTYQNGTLNWEVPGMKIRDQVNLTWEPNNNQFRFTSGPIEFVCTRR